MQYPPATRSLVRDTAVRSIKTKAKRFDSTQFAELMVHKQFRPQVPQRCFERIKQVPH